MYMKQKSNYEFHTIKSEEIKKEVKEYLNKKSHSCAYMKVCAKELKRLGYMNLSLALENISDSKMHFETMLLEALEMKEDIETNLNQVLIRAEEDVVFARKIELLAKTKKEKEVFCLMNELAKTEEENFIALMGIVKQIELR